jgi:hypothetical protein
LLQVIYAGGGWAKRGKRKTSSLTIRQVERFDGGFDDLWSRIENKRPVMIERTSEFLEWRFGAVPRRVYRKWVAVEGGRVRGYVISRLMDVEHMPCGMIADFVIEDSAVGLEAGDMLLSTAVESFQEGRVALSGCLMTRGTNEFRLLRRQGYFVCPPRLEPQPFPLILQPLQDSVLQGPVGDLGNWFLTTGDYDVV